MFRSLELNTALKGSKTSSHMKGEAMDITSMACGKENCKSNLDMFHWIKDNLEFDQLIWEFGQNLNGCTFLTTKTKTENKY